MKVINLIIKSKQYVNREIKTICGGKTIESFWVSGFQNGMGGLSFEDPESTNPDEKFMVSLALYKTGVGIYCRNMYNNYLVLIPETEIVSIKIIKDRDIISPFTFSIYTLLRKTGISYHTASKYLMPKEIIIEKPTHLIIQTDEKFFKLGVEKMSPDKLINVFKKSKFVNLLAVQIEMT